MADYEDGSLITPEWPKRWDRDVHGFLEKTPDCCHDTGKSDRIYVGYIGRHLPTGQTN